MGFVVAVAYSGGRDSTALLHATLAAAEPIGGRVVGLHVHHGLHPSADDWLAHCADRCRRWTAAGRPVDFAARRLTGAPVAGDSVEAWARERRYAALADLAREAGAELVLLAQHRRDQAETLLLQALRGAGVAGLAGMPDRVERDGIVWCRPWLRRSRDDIEAYLARHGLDFVDDDSNDDPRFARNRLRRAVWPVLGDAFAGAEASLAASARWAQEAASALGELAVLDLAALRRDDGIDIAAWLGLTPARRSLALRAWIAEQAGAPAAASLTERLLDELPHRRVGRWPHAGGELRLHRGALRFERTGDREADADLERELCVDRAGTYALPGWGGTLRVRRVREGGVPLAGLGCVELRPRHGGERFQAGPGRPPRSLKKQFQAAGIAAWHRGGPLVYSRGRLVYVPGLGLDARVLGAPGEPAVALEWRPAGTAIGPT